jgi:hypothetical protein
MARWLHVAALALAVATLGAAPGDVGVALVRADGRLQPLAHFDGDAWRPLAAADAAGGWSLWPFDDPEVKTLPFAARTARPVMAAPGTAGATACLPLSGADALLPPPSAVGSHAGPPSLGLALRGTDIRPDLPVAIAADTELGREVATRAAAAFHRAEDETLTLEAEELPAGFPRFADRRQRPVTWTLMVRQGLAQAATKTYYLEGRKDYQGFRGRTDIGQIRTTGHVFVQLTGPRETIDAEVDLSDVEGHQSMFRTPLAIIAWPARSAWVFSTRGTDGAHLEIVEVTAGTSRPRPVWQGIDGCGRGDR